jgi:GNAT superfamily N-acetyltransferase
LAPGFSLKALAAPDAATYNAFLRRGVRQHPDTLRISEADILAVPFRTQPTADAVTFVAMDEHGAYIGTVAVERERGREKRRHVAWLLRMYVDREHAGRGVGQALLMHAIAHARSLSGVAKLNLTVAAHNARAVALYARHGFREFSREDDAFRDPTPRAELSMSLTL